MNITVTSREEILKAAKHLAYGRGLGSINIRLVASECGVSVGSIYNYYETKSDLIIAVIEDFWKNAFLSISDEILHTQTFLDFYREFYEQMHVYLKDFQANWLEQMSVLSLKEKEDGRQKENEFFIYLKQIFAGKIDKDSRINRSAFTAQFQKEEFVEFCFVNMLLLLKDGRSDCKFMCQVIERLIY